MIVLKNIPIILFSITICSHVLTVEPRTKPAVQVEGEQTLGDVVELVVNANNLENRYVDLDTGTVFSYPKNMNTDSETEAAWREQKRIDMTFLLVDRKPSKIVHLLSCNMIVAPVSEDKWNCTEEELMLDAKKAEWERRFFPVEPANDSIVAKTDGDAAYPTFVFKTREGNVGVLQVLEILRNGQWDRQAKMRYWLLRNPSVKIEDDQIIWGEAVDGIVCAVKPTKESFLAGETLEFDIVYKNVSGQPITICTYPDNFYVWTQLWVVDSSGTDVARGQHGNGIRRPMNVSDFVTLQPGQTASVREKIAGHRKGKPRLKAGKYAAKASINEINKMQEHIVGFNEFCQKKILKTWTGMIKSGPSTFVILPNNDLSWGEAVADLQCRLRAIKSTWNLGEEPTLSLDLRNAGDSDIICAAITQNCEIEYDGQLYEWGGPAKVDILLFPLRPGKEYLNAVQIKIPTSWATKKRKGVPLVLTPDRHIIRVQYRPEASAWFKSDPKTVAAVSNPVEIEILPEVKSAVQVEGEGEENAAKGDMQQAVDGPIYRIVPGVRVGQIGKDTTEADLRRIYGTDNVEDANIPIGEGFYEQGTILFSKDDTRKLEILWRDTEKRRLPKKILITGVKSKWVIFDEITLGTKLSELQRINGKPFVLTGFSWDYEGTVIDWKNGSLKNQLGDLQTPSNRKVLLRLIENNAHIVSEEEYRSVQGDHPFSSSHPVMRKLNPGIFQIVVFFSEKLSKVDSDVQVEREESWGKAVNGVQCRLRTERIQWKRDEVPRFSMDLRNHIAGERFEHTTFRGSGDVGTCYLKETGAGI